MLAAPAPISSRRRTVFSGFVVLATILVTTPAARTATLPYGFQETTVFSGLTQPTAFKFAADGRIFVAEKSGLIKVFDNLTDPTPTIFADLRTNVHNYWDRGLLGLALDPSFPTTPYVYVLYTLDAAPGGTPPRWGTAGTTSDNCPDPPGGNTNGCVVGGRLSKLRASGDVMTGTEQVLLENWCQQFPSHSIGSLVFGSDGALYVSGGEGANFNAVDYGQYGYPTTNPCGDPPGGTNLSPPTAEGGALRAQDVRTTSDPVGFSGSILRVDPATGAAMPDNPLVSTYPNAGRIIAYGLRNPFRIAPRPGTHELWIGDVGWDTWEEIDRIGDVSDSIVENFGWPCYEGFAKQPGYQGTGLNICQGLYNAPGSVTDPYLSYQHSQQVVPGEVCGAGSSSITGLAFYGTGPYPSAYDGALFFADYSRSCIWALLPDANGDPDPTSALTFDGGASSPVDLQIGPGGDLYYADLNGGTIRRIQYTANNQSPIALIQANRTNGPNPLTVDFDGTGSLDPDPGDTITYSWDLNGDGVFGDSTAAKPTKVYTTSGTYTVGLRVTDSHGATGSDSIKITVGNSAPTATITTPLATTKWNVGTVIGFSGSATDPEQGSLPASGLSWTLIVHHCPSNCHTHTIQTFAGVASGSFSAPDHTYPSFLELQLTATDVGGLTDTKSVLLYPNTVTLSFDTVPSGLSLVVGPNMTTTPFQTTVIVGSTNSLSAPSPQSLNFTNYNFVSWSDGGARSHNITAPTAARSYVATYASTVPTTTPPPPTPAPGTCGNGVLDAGEQCDDGNTASGDCCSSICQIEATPCNLTQLGTIVARVTAPTGSGNKNLEVIRDGDMPPVGSTDSSRQYDTWDGANTAPEDWIGYTYPGVQTFSRVVFQEGMNFSDGGWFDTLTVQVRRNGVWTNVSGLTSTPAYPPNDGVSFEAYTLDFAAMSGDGVRIDGAPGGSADFISVGELQVYGGIVGGGAPAPTPTPAPGPTATAVAGDLAPLASAIIARVTAPTGIGNKSLEVIRDGDKPPVGTTDSSRQYDTYDGPDKASDDWIGYTFASAQTFSSVVFQEGLNFADGGWFKTLRVQVRQNGVWTNVAGLTSTPTYPANDGVGYETYTLTFTPAPGDGIRLDGAPGGSDAFISVAELEVYGSASGATATAQVPTPTPIVPTATTTLGAAATATRTATPIATATRTATPIATAVAPTPTPARGACGNGILDGGEQCDDGNTISGDCCSSTCQIEATPCNLTHLGTVVARVTAPTGSGNKSLEVIRDGDKPPVGSTDSSRQYDTWDGANTAAEDWIGYTYPSVQTFTRVVFQEGVNFADGGWFDTLTVQVRHNGVWTSVSGLTSSPAYPPNDGASYESYTLNFAAMSGDGIRLDGAPGGSADFISVGELEVYGGIVGAQPTPVPTATPGTNLAPLASAVIARVTAPTGSGSKSLEVIRDGDKPPVGTADSTRQYDTYDGANTAAEDWIGYTFAATHTFNRVVFQEGLHFWDGGWFDTVTVQVRQGGAWTSVSNLGITPAYSFGNDGIYYQSYILDFSAITGDGIRLDGAPGGSHDFISVGELEVYGPGG